MPKQLQLAISLYLWTRITDLPSNIIYVYKMLVFKYCSGSIQGRSQDFILRGKGISWRHCARRGENLEITLPLAQLYLIKNDNGIINGENEINVMLNEL